MADLASITVKSPVQATDVQVQTSLSNTVLQLKERLQSDHPARPEPASQRLIYGGRLLRDEEILSDVFPQVSVARRFFLFRRVTYPTVPWFASFLIDAILFVPA